MSTGPNLGLAPTVGHLIAELEAARDTTVAQTVSKWVEDLLPMVKFDPSEDPHGIVAEFWGRNFAAFEDQTLDPVVRQILIETHRQQGIPGAVQRSGGRLWLFRWDDQG